MWKVNLYLRMIFKSHTEVLLYVKPPLKFSSKCMLSSFSWHWGHTAKCWLRLHKATNPYDPGVPSPHAPAEPTSHKCLAKSVFLLKESINTCFCPWKHLSTRVSSRFHYRAGVLKYHTLLDDVCLLELSLGLFKSLIPVSFYCWQIHTIPSINCQVPF